MCFRSSHLCHVPLFDLDRSQESQHVQASQKQDSLLKDTWFCPQSSSVLGSVTFGVLS